MKSIKKVTAKALERLAAAYVGIASPMDWHQPKVPKKLQKKS